MFALNTLYDLICDVISCCVWSCNAGKINVYDKKSWLKARNKKENMKIKSNFYLNLYPKDGLGIQFTAC